jgi:peptide-methionine (S)-S-oxide reductase
MTLPAPAPGRRFGLLAVLAVSVAALAAACAGGAVGAGWGRANAVKTPVAAYDPAPATPGLRTAVLSGGCFWGVQGVFEHVKGVRKVLAGYAGGQKVTAEYELVSTGTTGHAESVQITYDPKVISYGEILRIYFSVATDPTQLDEQFPDQGPQYRGEIFYADPGQKEVAERYISQLTAAHVYHAKIVTRLDPMTGFFPAETYHQDYLERHPDAAYIATYDMPKVAALKSLFPTDYRPTAVLAL